MTVNPEDRPGDLGAPRTHKTGKCDDLASADVEADVVEHVLPHELVDGEHHLARHRASLLVHLAKIAPDHRADDGVHVELSGGRVQHELAVAHDRHLLADGEHLVAPG